MDDPKMTEFEADRTARVIAAFTCRLKSESRFNPMLIAMALFTYDRSPHNVMAQWEIDPDSVIKDCIALLRRHVEILEWMYQSRAEVVTACVPLDEMRRLRQSLGMQTLYDEMHERFVAFIEWIKENPEKEFFGQNR